MNPALILAQQIMELLKSAGVTKQEAHAALSISSTLLGVTPEVRLFSQDEREAIEAGEQLPLP